MTQTLAAIVIVAFAAYRLAAVIALDTISEPFRVWVYHRGHVESPLFTLEDVDQVASLLAEGGEPELSATMLDQYRSGAGFEIEAVDEPGSFAWRWFYGLISCPFCCGWWLSLAGWWAYTGEFFESRQWALQAVAVAGVQSAIPSNRAS